MQETWLQSVGQEDPLEEEVATCSRILAWEIPWTEEPGGYSSWGCKSQTRLSDCTTTTNLVLFGFALLPFMGTVFFFSPKLKVCGNPTCSKSIPAIFPTAFAHFVSLWQTLVIFTGFQTFLLLLYLS